MALPNTIKIDDITSGRVEPAELYAELDRMKIEANIIRNDMSLFLRTLASASPSQSQQHYQQLLALRLESVTASIQDYSRQYNRLLPVINLAQIRLGHDAEVIPPKPADAAEKPSSFAPNA